MWCPTASRQGSMLIGTPGHLGPTPSGAGTWREGFPALSEGRAGDLTLHSWKLGRGPGPQRPTPTPGTRPLPSGPCGASMERVGLWGAGHLTLLRWGRSLAPPRRVSRPPRQLNTACGLPPHTGASSSKRGVRGLRGRAERQPQGPAVCCPAPEKPLSPCWC